MILQALKAYYDRLAKLNVLPPWGWAHTDISVDVHLDTTGRLLRLVNVQHDVQRGKKTVQVPNALIAPAPAERTANVAPNFLWDNGEYILGLTLKGKQNRARTCYEAASQLHTSILGDVDSPVARAIVAFYETWNPDRAEDNEDVATLMPLLQRSVNLTFCDRDGNRAIDDPDIRDAWTEYCMSKESGPDDLCIITGRHTPHIALTHPRIKGVPGSQSNGAALVSFNSPAFCSYGRKQNANAPVSTEAAFAYTTALNYLLKGSNVLKIGTTTVIMWAESAESTYADFLSSLCDPNAVYNVEDLHDILASVCRGQSVEYHDEQLDPAMPFYILGLSPNAGRLSVRFFLQNSFGRFISNVNKHHNDLRIAGYDHAEDKLIALRQILRATLNRKSRDAKPQPLLSGALFRAVLEGTRYPSTLLTGVHLRIRAERQLSHTKAAIIKAYYTRNTSRHVPKEILTVHLNESSDCVPYMLGRLFSLYEQAQKAANEDAEINATITDRFFVSAGSTPAVVFPRLGNLAQKHIRKLRLNPAKERLGIALSREIAELGSRLGERFPSHLTLPEQGAFQLGYYAQTQARFTKGNKNSAKGDVLSKTAQTTTETV